MSCDIAAAAVIWLAAAVNAPAPPAPPPAVAHEPLFAEIVQRAGALKAEAERMRTSADSRVDEPFKRRIAELAALDMKGHLALAARGIDGDLKCILKGIAQDLPLKLQALEDSADAKARDMALRDMVYLLNDNVEVITAPPRPEA